MRLSRLALCAVFSLMTLSLGPGCEDPEPEPTGSGTDVPESLDVVAGSDPEDDAGPTGEPEDDAGGPEDDAGPLGGPGDDAGPTGGPEDDAGAEPEGDTMLVDDVDEPQPELGDVGDCCHDEGECMPGLLCVEAYLSMTDPPPDLTEWLDRVCAPPPGPGECWTADDCGPEETCGGPDAWMCWEELAPEPGTCKPKWPDHGQCCVWSSDCPEGQTCVDPGSGLPTGGFGDQAYAGVCVPDPDPGACWSYADCASGEDCVDPTLMWCWSLSETEFPVPGTCEAIGAPEGGCCQSDAECAGGLECMDPSAVGLTNGLVAWSGTCAAPAPEGQCYGEADCADGEYCAGGAMPWCWDGEPQLGTCVEGTPGLCCEVDGDCDAGDVCVEGTCLPAPPEGSCWDNGDCDCSWEECDGIPQSHCVGASYCPCDIACGQVLAAGSCQPIGLDVGGCCMGDWDCKDGLVCADPWPVEQSESAGDVAWSGTCAPAPGPDGCWTDADCHGGQVCEGAALPWCWEDGASASHPGVCHDAPGPGCDVFDGGCDDAIPPAPWYWFDGETCHMEDSCMCEGCPGAFATLAECQACMP